MATKKKTPKKPATKKPIAKKPVTKKAAAKKPVTKKAATKPTKKAPTNALSRAFGVTLGSEVHNLFFEVPFDVKETFGHGRAPVAVTITPTTPKHPKRGVPYSFRSTVAAYGGRSYVPVRKEHREAAAVKVGDRLDVVLVLDTEPRIVELPPELALHLGKDRGAATAWDRLSYTHQNEHVMAIAGAKKPDTKLRRIEATLSMLRKT